MNFDKENNNLNNSNSQNQGSYYNYSNQNNTAIPQDNTERGNEQENINYKTDANANSQNGRNFSNTTNFNQNQYENNVSPKRKRKNVLKIAVICLICVAAVGTTVIAALGINFLTNKVLKNKVFPQISVEETGEDEGIVSSNKPHGAELTIPQIAEKVKPSVVGIVVETQSQTPYFGIEGTQAGTGSGFIITDDGYIVTNSHVVDGASKITVFLDDVSGEYPATIIGSDPISDIAVIKINATGLPYVEFGDSDKLVIGETVVAIGNPYGLELAGTVTSGIVSSANRTITNREREMKVIQTDAAINPGNSGGPLINTRGQVIGINTMKIATNNSESLGFAIPISDAVDIINSLIKNGYVTDRPLIGISGQDIDEMASRVYGLPQGVYVAQVDAKSDAKAKGIQPYDIIIEANGKPVKSMAQLNAIKDEFKAGDSLPLKIWRSGKTMDVTIVLGENKPVQAN